MCKDKEITLLKHQRDALQRTVFEYGDKIVLQAEIIKGLQDTITELLAE